MDIFAILRRLIDAGAGRVISEAEHQLLHLELNKHDPSVPSEEEAARQAEAAAAAAKAEQDEFAQFKAWKDARDAATPLPEPTAPLPSVPLPGVTRG